MRLLSGRRSIHLWFPWPAPNCKLRSGPGGHERGLRSLAQPPDGAQPMLSRTRKLLESTVENYIASDGLTRGAAIAFYSVTSLIPVLLIVIAIAGVFFGESAAGRRCERTRHAHWDRQRQAHSRSNRKRLRQRLQ